MSASALSHRAPTPRRRGGWFRALVHASPPRFAIVVFSGLVLIWTSLLSLPIASRSGEITPFADALFTAVSAICVTGLSTVDMATHWSLFGEIMILLGLQIGGVGVLTIASLLAVTVTGRLGLRQRLLVANDTNPMRATRGASESQAIGLGEIGGLLRAVVTSLLVIELGLTALIVPRLMIEGLDFAHALWNGFYLAASAFTNTGFVPLPNGLTPFLGDYYLLSVLAIGVFLGSIGFPVIFALYRFVTAESQRRKHLGLHSKLTLAATIALVIFGWILIAGLEWGNPATLGDASAGRTLYDSLYMSVMTRSGGLGIIDPMAMHGSTRLVLDMLMFVGGGSASTAGGIKVTTLAVLFLAAYSEARGYRDIQAFSRRIPTEVLRVAVSVLIWGATIVLVASITIMQMTGASLDETLFEVISAFGTCGLSSGLSGTLPDSGKYVLAATMWAGRVGTVTLATAVAATARSRMFRFPEERPIVG